MNSVTSSVKSADPSITAFLTDVGVDLILRRGDEQTRASAPYDTMACVLANRRADVDLTENDEVILVNFDGTDVVLKLQPKGHYFGWLAPIKRSKLVDITEARALLRKAAHSKATKPSRPAAEPEQTDADDCPF